MTKKHKRFTGWKKENVGCMRGLISIFDFRQGRSTQRFLSDKKCGSSRNLGISYSRNKVGLPCNNIEENHGDVENITPISDTEAEEDNRINLGVSSFNTLRKKEMPRAHHSRKEFDSKIDWIKAELGIGANVEKNHKESTKSGVVGSKNNLNSSPSLMSQQSDYPNMSTLLSSDIDLGEFMLDYCKNGLYWERKQFEYENKTGQFPFPANESDLKMSEHDVASVTILQKAIIDLSEAFLRHNSINSSENKDVHQLKDIVNVFEILNSNKQLFLEILQDPNSSIRKHIQEFQNVQYGKASIQNQLFDELPVSKRFQKQSGPYLFRTKDKLTVVCQSNERDDVNGPNTIVVLKPSQLRNQNLSSTIAATASTPSDCNLENKEDRERLSSNFSVKEIRRRFRNVIGPSKKGKDRIAMDGIMHKIPYGEHISRKNATSCSREHTENGREIRSDNKEIQKKNHRSDTKEVQKKNQFSIASKKAGRKKLSKNAAPSVLYTEAAFCDEARKHLAEFLRIGSENESLPSIQVSKSLGRILSFPGFNSPRHNLAREKDAKEAESLQENTSLLLNNSKQKNIAEHLDLLRHKESFPSTDKIPEAVNEIMEIMEVEDKECIQIEEASQLEAQSILTINEDDLPSGTFVEEESSMLLEPEQSEAKTLISSISSEKQVLKDADCAVEKAVHPSPIAVLEPLFLEDPIMITDHATTLETKTQPRESQIDDSAAASGSTDSEEDLITCSEFDEALLFDELEVSYSLFIDDPKLLFDSIDEVLTEIKERHFSCTPWVSLIKPTIWSVPKQEYFMKEGCRRINWHLDVQSPSTLKHAVKKDLDGTIWFDLQFEAERAVGEIGDAILDYLFEETALELWD
ncbi:hypothetical protein M5K25_010275 [Dendrobium thyrsiflorum]|uniref:DUF4378 domain-containing protein n=1 Tax=Dendrobium thyrsiflorum TaxID=117978 RepID=A0ABD0V6M4_DENTH